MTDAEYMARALALAERGLVTNSPNPMVCAIVVDRDGVVVGRGSHERAGGPHAEVHALREAGERARGATLYCTLEPCSHVGRTGPCAPLIGNAGVARAVIAVEDPNPLVAGRGIGCLRSHDIDVMVGIGRREATALNRPFFTSMQYGRPFVIAKIAVSLDARVAEGPGLRTRLTGHAAYWRVHRDRAEVDAIGVGSGTILVDDPLLTARGVYRARPLLRVVFDRRLRTPPTARLFSTLAAGPIMIATSPAAVATQCRRADALRDAGADLRVIEHERSLSSMLRQLADEGIRSIVLEGGPSLHQAAWNEGVVDCVQMFVAPSILGPAGVSWLPIAAFRLTDLVDVTSEPLGEDVLIQGFVRTDVHRPD